MGFGDDLGGMSVISLAFNIISKILSLMAKIFMKIFKLVFEKDPKKVAAQAAFEAKNPIANEQLTSLEPRGIFFGRQHKHYVIKPEKMDGHILVVGGPGSGKSSCIAIPTLWGWKGSVFAIDIKGELHAKTQEYRKNIKVFAPQDKTGAYCYDPYVFLKESENISQEVRAIAQSIIPLPPDAKEPFWIESAQIVLTGAILHYYDLRYSFIDTLMKIQSQNPEDLINIVSKSRNIKAKLCVKSFVGMEGKTLAGISAEISRGITTLVTDDEIIRALTPEAGRTAISPTDLEEGYDIYIKIPEHLLRQWKNLLTLMVNQFITFFERRGESNYNRPILFLLDEFPRLGKIPAITDALATLRSKKITICLVVQSLAQLEMIYGRDARKVIADTCAFKAVLGATDADTQEYFSKLVGTYEKISNSQSQNFDPYVGAPTGSGRSSSQDKEVRIIKPEEFAFLRDIVLLYPLPLNFCRVQKQPYYLTAR
ncbi:MAG: type IV secretory system conjugative DNA transfer family protein [Nitrososphaerota archaeon]|jgi:type IV secretion system protein VirD4|nr:type IV secretory system conjugative DNA transfer family protein [Nitrososphaerota archaeon]